MQVDLLEQFEKVAEEMNEEAAEKTPEEVAEDVAEEVAEEAAEEVAKEEADDSSSDSELKKRSGGEKNEGEKDKADAEGDSVRYMLASKTTCSNESRKNLSDEATFASNGDASAGQQLINLLPKRDQTSIRSTE
jgi:hypothetical protein